MTTTLCRRRRRLRTRCCCRLEPGAAPLTSRTFRQARMRIMRVHRRTTRERARLVRVLLVFDSPCAACVLVCTCNPQRPLCRRLLRLLMRFFFRKQQGRKERGQQQTNRRHTQQPKCIVTILRVGWLGGWLGGWVGGRGRRLTLLRHYSLRVRVVYVKATPALIALGRLPHRLVPARRRRRRSAKGKSNERVDE